MTGSTPASVATCSAWPTRSRMRPTSAKLREVQAADPRHWGEQMGVRGAPASVPQWVEETAKLWAQLPQDVQDTLRRHEDAETTADREYQLATMEFYRRHVCRVDPWPDCVQRSMAEVEHGIVHGTMNGPSEFHVTGTLRDWSIVDRLAEINVATLVVTGEYDEATPAINQTVAQGIPHAESVVFPDASHMAHVGHPAATIDLLDDFMSRKEGQRGPGR